MYRSDLTTSSHYSDFSEPNAVPKIILQRPDREREMVQQQLETEMKGYHEPSVIVQHPSDYSDFSEPNETVKNRPVLIVDKENNLQSITNEQYRNKLESLRLIDQGKMDKLDLLLDQHPDMKTEQQQTFVIPPLEDTDPQLKILKEIRNLLANKSPQKKVVEEMKKEEKKETKTQIPPLEKEEKKKIEELNSFLKTVLPSSPPPPSPKKPKRVYRKRTKKEEKETDALQKSKIPALDEERTGPTTRSVTRKELEQLTSSSSSSSSQPGLIRSSHPIGEMLKTKKEGKGGAPMAQRLGKKTKKRKGNNRTIQQTLEGEILSGNDNPILSRILRHLSSS